MRITRRQLIVIDFERCRIGNRWRWRCSRHCHRRRRRRRRCYWRGGFVIICCCRLDLSAVTTSRGGRIIRSVAACIWFSFFGRGRTACTTGFAFGFWCHFVLQRCSTTIINTTYHITRTYGVELGRTIGSLDNTTRDTAPTAKFKNVTGLFDQMTWDLQNFVTTRFAMRFDETKPET